MTTIDVASVKIQPDLTGFASATDAGIDRGLAGAETSIDAAIAAMEAQFAELANVISEEFGSIQISAEDAFGDMVAEVEATGAAIESEFADVAATIADEFNAAQQAANRNLDQISTKGEETGGRLKGAFGVISSGVTTAATAIGGGLALLTVFGLKSAANLEQVNVALDSLTGSVAAGTAQFKGLQQFAAATPFEFKDLTTSAERFDAFAAAIGQTQAQLEPFLTTIGNLVSETGGGAQALDSITLALGQTASQGKLTLGNLEQINNALPGFSSVAALAKIRGESTAQVMQEISAGSIDAKTGINQLLQGMQQFPGAAGAMQKQSETLLGVFSTFTDTMSQALSNAFAPVIPSIKDALTQITPIVGDALKQLGPALGTVLSSLLPLLGNLVKAITPILIPVLDALAVVIGKISPLLVPLGAAVTQVLLAFMPLVPVIADLGVKLLTALLPAVITLVPLIIDLVNPTITLLNFISSHLGAVEDFAAVILAIVGAVKLYNIVMGIAALVTDGLTLAFGIFDTLLAASGVGLIIVGIVALVAGIVLLATKTQFFQTIWSGLWGFLKMIGAWFAGPFVNFFVNAYHDVIKFFVDLPGEIWSALKALPGLLETLISDMFHALFFLIGFEIGLIIKEFMDLPDQIIFIFTELWDALVALFTQFLPYLFGLLSSWGDDLQGLFNRVMSAIGHIIEVGVDYVVSFFEKLPGRALKFIEALPGMLKKAASAAASWLYDAGKNVVLGFINGIKDYIGAAIDAVKGAFNDVKHGAESALGINSPSKVFMEIGRQSVAGYNKGIDDHSGTTADSINNLLSPRGQGNSSTSSSMAFGAGSIVVNVNGGMSTQQAYQVGAAVGQGITDQLATRDIRQQVRTM